MKKRAYPLFFASNRYIRASVYGRTEKNCLSLSLITSSLSINHLLYRASRMGANFPSLSPKPSVAKKKLYERSEFRVAFAFFKSHENINQKLPQRIERKRDSIEFERSENQGQFFMIQVFNYFKVFKCFSTCYKPYISMFSEYI